MDPSDLKNVSFPLVSDVGINLYNGSLRNIAQLKRAGPCTISIENEAVIVKGVFGWDNLEFDYGYMTKIWSILMSGKLLGELTDLKATIVLKISMKNHEVILEQFEFVDAGNIKVEFEGNSIDLIANQAIKIFTWMSKDLILQKVSEEIENFIEIDIAELNKLLPEYHMAQYKFINNVHHGHTLTTV
ncbi:hypothetical protein QAD02_006113 [Eretmocerus hayati]|uniref:Uncharacterized protein n=1 Tax=Eretmocerus hayati TaxID=131215 RepID=A0ACC2N156_9HYME|nr:hypothetical protein QAD02_006113 [Eretmocerus hayati]